VTRRRRYGGRTTIRLPRSLAAAIAIAANGGVLSGLCPEGGAGMEVAVERPAFRFRPP